MVKNTKVNVEFITSIKQEEKLNQLKLDAIGTLSSNDIFDKLSFQATLADQNYHMEIHISQGNIKIKQHKPNPSLLEFDTSKKTFANYSTEYGNLELVIKTSKLITKPGLVLIEYLIDDQNSNSSTYSMSLIYKEV